MNKELKAKMIKLNKQMDRFIKSGFKRSMFTNDLYEMLHVDTNVFIAHFNKDSFHSIRFEFNASETIDLLDVVTKPELVLICEKLKEAMISKMYTKTKTICETSVL